MKEKRLSPALRISFIYAMMGGLWILLSDRIVSRLFSNPDQLLAIQTYKGWFFVASTAFILFLLIKNEKNILKKAEQNFLELFKSATEGIFRCSPEGRFIIVNAAMAKIFGYASPQEMIEQITDIGSQIYLSAESHKHFTKIVERDEMVERFEARNQKKDGSIIWTSTNARAIRDKSGKVQYYEGFITDITRQKSAESALIETEKRYRTLVENLPAVVFMDNFNDAQRTQYMSPRLQDLLGYTPEEWESGNNMWENSLHPDDKDRVLAEDIRTDETGEPFRIEYRLRRRDGNYVWIKEDASIVKGEDGTPLFWQGILLDISGQKQVEESLQRRDTILKAVGFSAEQFLKFANWEDCINLVLEELGKATKVSRVNVFKKYLSPDNIIMVSQVAEWCSQESEPRINNPELQNKDFAADGFSRWIDFFNKGMPVYGSIRNFPDEEKFFLAEQDILSLICIPLQVGKDWWGFIGFDECSREREWSEAEVEALKAAANTFSTAIEKKISEEALLNSETSYRGLFNSIHNAIYILDANGVFLDVNDGATEMYGYPKEYFIGKTLAVLSAPGRNNLDEIVQSFQHAFQGKSQQLEFWGIRSNGEVFPKDVHLFKGNYFGQDAIIAVAQDITERKHSENKTQRQLKELTVLHAVALAESTSKSVDELLQQVTDIIGDMLYPDTCGILLLNEAHNSLKPHFSYRGTDDEDRSLYIPVTTGITGKVAYSGQSICTGDVSLEPAYYAAKEGIRSELCVPLSNGQGIIGVLNVESRQPNAFTKNDERLLNTITGGMAKAIERIQLFEMEKRRLHQAEILRETTGELTSLFERERIFETIFTSLEKLIGYDSASIEIYSQGCFEIVAVKNIPNQLIGRKYVSSLEKWGEIYYLHQPVIISDIQQDTRFEKFEETSYIRGWMGIPLFSKDKIIGILNLDSRVPGFFNEEHASLAQTFANQAAIAMENARLFNLERQRREQAEILREVTGELNSFFEEEKPFEKIFNLLEKLIGYDSASIEVAHEGCFEIIAGKNIPDKLIGIKYPSDLEKWGDLDHERRPIIIPDVQQDDRFTKFDETSYIRSWMAIPMFVTDKIIGFLNLDSRTPGFFNEEHVAVAQTFANQTAIAMENARLFQEERRRSKIIEAMANIANEIAVTQEMIPALDKIAQHTLALLNAFAVAVYLLQDDNQTIKIIAAQGAYRKELLSHTIKIGTGITGNIIAAGKPEIVDDIAKDPRRVTVPGTPREDANFETLMSAPLILHGTSIGAINVWRLKPNGLFDQSELNFLVSIAHQASISIESMRLFEETRRRAQEAAAIAEVGRDISSTLQLNNVLERIAMYAKTLLNAETSAVYLSEPGLLRAIAAVGLEAEEIKSDPVQIGNGILGGIALHRSGEIVNNTINDPRAIAVQGTEIGMHEHIMSAPMLSKDDLTGLLVVWRSGAGKEFKETELVFLRSLAQQAAVAIENARLFELEHHRRREAEILNQATSALANTLDINSIYENILDWLQRIAPYDSASIFLHIGDAEKLVAMRNLPVRFQIGQIVPMTKKWKQIAESRMPYIAVDAQQSEYFEAWEDCSFIHGWMCIAMYVQDKLIGFIYLDSNTAGAFTEEHGILIQTFANQAATAIENARLFELEQKRRKDAEIIRQAATILTNLLDLPSLHEAILEWLQRITPYDSASILELEGNHIRLTAARGLPNLEKVLNQTFSQDNILCRIINETYEPLIIEDCEVDSRFENWGEAQNIHGWMGVPMISRGQVIGYITLDSHTPGAFTQNDAITTQTFAHQAATSLENSRLFTETKQRLEELEIVSRISFALRAARDTQEMLPILLNEIKVSMDTKSAAIWLYEFEINELVIKAASGKFESLPNSNFKPGEGIVGMVYSNGMAHITNRADTDIVLHPANMEIFREDWSGITVPIRTTSETIGALSVALNAPRTIKAHQIRLITTLAEMAGNAIHRSNLYERSEEQIQRLTTLRELDTAIASSLDLRITLSILTEHLMTKMGVSATNVLVFNPDSQSLDYLASAGFKSQKEMRTTMKIGDGLAGEILLSRRAFYIKNLNEQDTPRRLKPTHYEQFTSYYAVPLFSKGATRGILETYFRQPFSPSADWIEFIHTLAEQAVIAIDNAQLFENLQKSNQELSLAYDTTLEGWGKALELRDKQTQGHTQRVTHLALGLARQMNISEPELLQIRRGSLLHDIGKMGVPDNILRKNGTLTEKEQIEMRKHTQYAYDMLHPIEYLHPALDIAYCHHEWWDGSGYPRGLKGEEIPLSARIFAIIDVWDALFSDRPYRKAWEREKIVEYIRGLSGKQFDPRVVEEFFRMIDESEK